MSGLSLISIYEIRVFYFLAGVDNREG